MKLRVFLLTAMICTLCVGQASALEYTMDAPEDHLFGRPTSDDTIYEWEDPNVDRSKNTALIPPGFGSPTSYLPGSGGYLGTLKIPAIGLSVRVYEGTDSGTLAKGAGHFPGTSIWDGNVCVAGHNRGVRDDFGDLHTLKPGDTVTWTTKLGTRTYEVVSVEKVLETDTSGTTSTSDNRLTLYTCVKNQRAYRWCVTAVAK